MRQKLRTRATIFALIIVGLLMPVFVFAESALSISPEGTEFAENLAIRTDANLGTIIARIINVALGFLGIVAVVLILYAGIIWMTSKGEQEKIQTAKKIMVRAAIGLAIILSSLGIVQLVLRMLGISTQADLVPTPATTAVVRSGGGALGSGIVESHFPNRGATGVPRNTRILLTFKDAINPASIATSPTGRFFTSEAVAGGGELSRIAEPGLKVRPDSVMVVKTADIKTTVRDDRTKPFRMGSETTGQLIDVLVSFTPDLRTYVLTPVERGTSDRRVLFGSSTENTNYTVYLCGVASNREGCASGGLKIMPPDVRAKAGDVRASDLMNGTTALGVEAFAGTYKDYEWSFEVSTIVDMTPPTITSIVPLPDKGRDTATALVGRADKPRNTLVQVNFSEAMMPTVMEGRVMTVGANNQSSTIGTLASRSFDRLLVTAGDSTVAGNWASGNQYQTTEFTSAELCGKNSCGQDVYCLPRAARITVKLLTAAHTSGRDFTVTSIVPDGLQDVAGNALDGNRNNRPDGNAAYYDISCDATIGYATCSADDAKKGDHVAWSFETSSAIELRPPHIVESNPEFREGNISPNEPVSMTFSRPMSLVSLNARTIDLAGAQTDDKKPWEGWWDIVSVHLDANGDRDPDQSTTTIRHNDFWAATDFRSRVTRDVKDIFQNCYFPTGDDGRCIEGSRDERQNYCCNGEWQQSDRCGF